VNYFQVIFTLPDRLSSLILGNRRIRYNLLLPGTAQRPIYPAAAKVCSIGKRLIAAG